MLDSDIHSCSLSFLFFLVSGHMQVLSSVHGPHSEVPVLEAFSPEKEEITDDLLVPQPRP